MVGIFLHSLFWFHFFFCLWFAALAVDVANDLEFPFGFEYLNQQRVTTNDKIMYIFDGWTVSHLIMYSKDSEKKNIFDSKGWNRKDTCTRAYKSVDLFFGDNVKWRQKVIKIMIFSSVFGLSLPLIYEHTRLKIYRASLAAKNLIS